MSSHNPLGKVFSPEELRSIGDLCVARNIIILADEVYERLHYTPTYPRIATLSPQIAARTISIGSVGKTFNATGWRVGYAIGNENLIKHVQWAHVLLSYVTPGPAQEAAAAAYEDPRSEEFFDDNRTLFRQKIHIFCQILDDLGLTYFLPSGAYFILVNISTLRLPSSFELPAAISKKGMDWKMSYYMCHELGVSSIPGSAFFLQEHAVLGESFVRFVACKTDEQIELAKTRLQGLKALTAPSLQLTPLRGKL
ncbi:MAG: hypothetical protein L6R36_003911 [Xanthoria steineri]|nr:MAG: hypothetical protein L6R36_003911 [Xanthoria steineri]